MIAETYLITGATGYIGSLLAERLLEEMRTVTVIVRRPDRLKAALRGRVSVISGDITDRSAMRQVKDNFDVLIHCASPTQSAYMITNPVETAESIVDGTRNMLELAVRRRIRSMVYLSSMEVYGRIDCSGRRRVTEEELGELDIANIRSCYPMAKRMAEHYCRLYHQEYGVPVTIARLAQTFGRGVPGEDGRVFAQFARAVRENTDIVLHTGGASTGNYCDIDDVLEAILLLSEKGRPPEAYNVVNEENTMTIRQMAQLVADRVAGKNIGIAYDIPPDNRYGYAADTGLRLSSEKLRALGWRPQTGLEDMYRSMLRQDVK